jgi:hypothetical protein
MLYAQNFLINWEIIDERFDERFDEIVNDKCDDEIVIYLLSQLKKEHVIDAFFCYDVLIFDRE